MEQVNAVFARKRMKKIKRHDIIGANNPKEIYKYNVYSSLRNAVRW